MVIREAVESDIPAIVDLLKGSLGESLMPKSERFWRWKHVDNPFGVSPVLLCLEDGQIIGVRAFMRWEWQNHSQVYRALRAVDTATHPDHQGKGIFKKLTLSLVDTCSRAGDHLVFNTPNLQSRPGYLKMGWVQAGKLPVRMDLHRPFSMLGNMVFGKINNHELASEVDYYLQHPGLKTLLEKHYRNVDSLVTRVSPQYLNWRYSSVPVASYVAIGEENNDKLVGLIIGRIKQTRFGRELRITDCFFSTEVSNTALIKKFKEWKKAWKIDYVTLSGTLHSPAIKLFSLLNFKASVGPIVTIRSLSLTDLSAFALFKNWSPSIGDLELF